MTDDQLPAAVDRIRAATAGDIMPLGPLHLRYELKMIDAKGKQHAGTYETWTTAEAKRTEVHTDTYNGIEVSKDGKRWVKEDSLRPLRVMEFEGEQVLPQESVTRSLTGTPKAMKTRKVNGLSLMCGGNGQSALLCFDPLTGFLVFGAVDGGSVEYAQWRKLGWRYLAGSVRITRQDNLLVEAKMTVASGGVAAEAFTVPQGAVEYNVSSRTNTGSQDLRFSGTVATGSGSLEMVPLGPDTSDVGLDASGKHRLLTRGGHGNVFPRVSGRAQVKVWVDERGHVTKAVLEDADDMDVAGAALASARGATYAPEQDNGHPVGFETSYDFSITVAEIFFQ